MQWVTAGDSGRGGGRRRVHALRSAGPGGSSGSVRAGLGRRRHTARTRHHARPTCLAAATAREVGPSRLRVDPGRPRPRVLAAAHRPGAAAALGRALGASRGCRSRAKPAPLDEQLSGWGSWGSLRPRRRRRRSGPHATSGAMGEAPKRLQLLGPRRARCPPATARWAPRRPSRPRPGGKRGLAARAGVACGRGGSERRLTAAPRGARALGGPEAPGAGVPRAPEAGRYGPPSPLPSALPVRTPSKRVVPGPPRRDSAAACNTVGRDGWPSPRGFLPGGLVGAPISELSSLSG